MAASAAHGASSDPSAVPLATRLEEANTLKALGNDQYGKKNYAVAITHYTDAIARLPPRPDDVPDDAPEEEPEEEPDAPQEISAAASEPQDASVPAQSVTLEEHLVFEEIGALRVKLYANLAACHLKLVRTFVLTQDQLDETIRASTEGRWPADAVLCEEPKNVKALHRRAVAHEKLGGWAHLNDALQDYQRLDALDKEGYVPTSFGPELRASLARVRGLVNEAGEKEKTEMMGKLKTLGNNVLGYFGLSTDNFQLSQQEGGGYALNFVR